MSEGSQRKNTAVMGTDGLISLLLRFSLPAIVGMIVSAAYNIVDRIFVGQAVGPLGLASITVNFPIAMLTGASSVIIGFGANTLFSIRMGEGKVKEAEHIFGNGVLLLFVIPVLMSLALFIVLEPLLGIIGASPETMEMAKAYTEIVLIGSPIASLSHGMTHFIRSDGHPTVAMSTQLLGAIVNIGLGALFVWHFKWGVTGAAWATVAAQLLSALYVIAYFLSPWSQTKLRLRNFSLDWKRIVWPFTLLGLPQFVMNIANSLINAVLNRALLEHGGDMAVSTIAVLTSANTLFLMPMFGVAQGAQPLLGYNFGARKLDRVRGLYKYAVIGATLYAFVSWLLCMIFSPQIVEIFSDDRSLLTIATPAMRMFNFMICVIPFQMMSTTLFQSIGKPFISLLLSLSRQMLILTPLILTMPRIIPAIFNLTSLDGVWLSFPTSDTLSAVLAFFMVRYYWKRLENILPLSSGPMSKIDTTPPSDLSPR